MTATATATASAVAAAAAAAAAAAEATTTKMATKIALLATIESTGAAVVLLSHGAKPPWPCLAQWSSAIREPEHIKAGEFELCQCANVRAFVLG